jgi:hypothetical protein
MDFALRGERVSAPESILVFPHNWIAEILPARPLILPQHAYIYPQAAEEVERGALEILIKPASKGIQPFLATCALGFRDPSVPNGLWSCPNPEEICAVSGGYAYIINTITPERFTMLPLRPVMQIWPVSEAGLLIFAGHHSILAWGGEGLAWQSNKLSDEGVTIVSVEDGTLRGTGWHMMTDKETDFALDVKTGQTIG